MQKLAAGKNFADITPILYASCRFPSWSAVLLREGNHPTNTILAERLTPESLRQARRALRTQSIQARVAWCIVSLGRWGVTQQSGAKGIIPEMPVIESPPTPGIIARLIHLYDAIVGSRKDNHEREPSRWKAGRTIDACRRAQTDHGLLYRRA